MLIRHAAQGVSCEYRKEELLILDGVPPSGVKHTEKCSDRFVVVIRTVHNQCVAGAEEPRTGRVECKRRNR